MAKVRLQAKSTSSTPSSTSTTTTSSLAPLPSESIAAPGTSYADALKHKSEGSVAATNVNVNDERYKDAMDVLKKVYKAKVRFVSTLSLSLLSTLSVQRRVANKPPLTHSLTPLSLPPSHFQGFTGLYQGMEAQITKGVLAQGITFVLKDQFEAYAYFLLLLLAKQQTPTPSLPRLPSASQVVQYAGETLGDQEK